MLRLCDRIAKKLTWLDNHESLIINIKIKYRLNPTAYLQNAFGLVVAQNFKDFLPTKIHHNALKVIVAVNIVLRIAVYVSIWVRFALFVCFVIWFALCGVLLCFLITPPYATCALVVE